MVEEYRRRFLKYVGIAGMVGVAGCSGSGDRTDGGASNNDGADTASPADSESTTTSDDMNTDGTTAEGTGTDTDGGPSNENDATDTAAGTESDAATTEETETATPTETDDGDRFPRYEVIEDPDAYDEDLPWLDKYVGFEESMGALAVNDADNLTVMGWVSQINEGEARNIVDAEDSFRVQISYRNDGDEEIDVGGISGDYELEVFPYVGDERIDPDMSEGSNSGSLVPGQWGNFSTELHTDTEPAEFDRYEIHITD